jgi:hypothetical protein
MSLRYHRRLQSRRAYTCLSRTDHTMLRCYSKIRRCKKDVILKRRTTYLEVIHRFDNKSVHTEPAIICSISIGLFFCSSKCRKMCIRLLKKKLQRLQLFKRSVYNSSVAKIKFMLGSTDHNVLQATQLNQVFIN